MAALSLNRMPEPSSASITSVRASFLASTCSRREGDVSVGMSTGTTPSSPTALSVGPSRSVADDDPSRALGGEPLPDAIGLRSAQHDGRSLHVGTAAELTPEPLRH